MNVYILVLNWNRKDDTLSCIHSLLAASIDLSNIIVIDNNSSDGSVELVRDKFPGITLIQSTTNVGFSGGNNIGIRAALERGADAVVLLNNDTEVDAGFIEPLLQALQLNDVGIVGSKIYFHDRPEIVWFGRPVINRTSARTYDLEYGETDCGAVEPREVSFVSGCAMAIKSSVIEKIGYLDERYFCYSEELDYCLRAEKAGIKQLIVPSSKIYHKVSGSTGGRTSGFTMYYRVRNCLLFAKNNLPLDSWFAEGLRSIFIVILHCAALFKSDMKKMEGMRNLILGITDYYKGRFGKRGEI